MARLIRSDFRSDTEPFSGLTRLSFVADVKTAPRRTRRCFWQVPPTSDTGMANSAGRQMAADLLQYLKDCPGTAGGNLLGRLVQDMAAHPLGTPTHGYEVGFWSALELVLHRATVTLDHWALLQQSEDQAAAITYARAAELTARPVGAVQAVEA